MLVQQTLHRTS